jgi:hypothetical protein
MNMKKVVISFLVIICFQFSLAQDNKSNTNAKTYSAIAQEILALSKQKWLWMADKNVEMLKPLFDDKSKFVHMSGTWNKEEELDVIKTSRIWYKTAKIHDATVEFFHKTAIVWNRITLEAIVRGSEVTTEFTVTEVYQKNGKNWKLLALTFSSVRDTHQIQK